MKNKQQVYNFHQIGCKMTRLKAAVKRADMIKSGIYHNLPTVPSLPKRGFTKPLHPRVISRMAKRLS